MRLCSVTSYGSDSERCDSHLAACQIENLVGTDEFEFLGLLCGISRFLSIATRLCLDIYPDIHEVRVSILLLALICYAVNNIPNESGFSLTVMEIAPDSCNQQFDVLSLAFILDTL